MCVCYNDGTHSSLRIGHGGPWDLMGRWTCRADVIILAGILQRSLVQRCTLMLQNLVLTLPVVLAVDPEGSNVTLGAWRSNVSLYFSWLFMGSKAVFFFFIVYVAIRFRGVKLGHKDEPPEFDSASYFSMIFAAGVAVGLFVSRAIGVGNSLHSHSLSSRSLA